MSGFFKSYGTLSEDAPCYIKRPADDDLLKVLEKDELCMVLAPRQTGKSSLIAHAVSRLKTMGMSAAFVELQHLGSQNDPNTWFGAVVYQISRFLRLQTDPENWWNTHHIAPTQRFMTFLEDVVLSEIQNRVVIFFDEIDSALPLPFSDDFFTTIRAIVNAKASNPVLRRLNFVLSGVAAPSEFIKNRARTPFNIGREIALKDFDPESLVPFQTILGANGKPLVDRIFYWTSGQPQMVQKMAESVYALPEPERTPEQVDETVQKTYLGVKIDSETHLKFISDYLLEEKKKVRNRLKVYKAVLDGKPVLYDEKSPVHIRLKLAGVVQVKDKTLFSRNQIYQTVFSKEWVKKNTPVDKAKITIFALSLTLAAVLTWFLLLEPKFKYLGEQIYYSAEKETVLEAAMPSQDIKRVKADHGKVILEKDKELKKNDRILISFDKLEVGENPRRVRFYGEKENFETRMLIIYFPEQLWKPLTDIEMVNVPKGCFIMGCDDENDSNCYSSEKPAHQVCLSEFQIGKYEVTQGQWKQLMGYNPSSFKKGDWYPVERVSWNDAQEFIRRLNKISNKNYRLPTEAEWEYAARAGSRKAFANGDMTKTGCDIDPNLDKIGWYCGNSGKQTHEVGQKDANAWGLFDMHGNVWEWVEDDYYSYKNAPDDGRAWVDNPRGSIRVIRGGSWGNDARDCRSAYRDYWHPVYRNVIVGFRLSRSSP